LRWTCLFVRHQDCLSFVAIRPDKPIRSFKHDSARKHNPPITRWRRVCPSADPTKADSIIPGCIHCVRTSWFSFRVSVLFPGQIIKSLNRPAAALLCSQLYYWLKKLLFVRSRPLQPAEYTHLIFASRINRIDRSITSFLPLGLSDEPSGKL